jgi:hypothetical protein
MQAIIVTLCFWHFSYPVMSMLNTRSYWQMSPDAGQSLLATTSLWRDNVWWIDYLLGCLVLDYFLPRCEYPSLPTTFSNKCHFTARCFTGINGWF